MVSGLLLLAFVRFFIVLLAGVVVWVTGAGIVVRRVRIVVVVVGRFVVIRFLRFTGVVLASDLGLSFPVPCIGVLGLLSHKE